MKTLTGGFAALSLAGAATFAYAQQDTTPTTTSTPPAATAPAETPPAATTTTTTEVTVETPAADAKATFGMDVRALAQGERDPERRGIGPVVSALAKARNELRRAARMGAEETEVATARTTTTTTATSARTSAEAVAAARGANRAISTRSGAVADLRAAIRSDVAQTRGNSASVRADVAGARSNVASLRADVATNVAQARSAKDVVAAARLGRGK
jgi:hypothetical protein